MRPVACDEGSGKMIPGGSMLIFEVELLKLKGAWSPGGKKKSKKKGKKARKAKKAKDEM